LISSAQPTDDRVIAATVTLPRHVVHRPFPTETVILNLETGQYHGVNPTGGRMLAVLLERGEVRSAAEALAAEFKRPLDEIAADVCAFCRELAARGLIELSRPEARG
jgi:Coenzyme PQQ synthesis protein D (PqqD)